MHDIATTVSRVANETYSHTRNIMPPQPWWDNLESSFHKFPDDFELDLRTELTVRSTALSDYCLRTLAASLISFLALPTSLTLKQLKQDRELSDLYKQKANLVDPDSFFVRPDSAVVEVHTSPAGLLRFKPDDGVCELLSFDSPFKPVHPNMHRPYLKKKNNMRAVAQHWRHNNGPRPTLCVIHGFMADPYWLNRMIFALPLWDHWDRPRIHWFPGNHLVHLDRGKYLREMAAFMKDIEFDKQ